MFKSQTDLVFQAKGLKISEKKKKKSNKHSYNINKLSTKTDTQIIVGRCIYLPTKTKDKKYYCFLVYYL